LIAPIVDTDFYQGFSYEVGVSSSELFADMYNFPKFPLQKLGMISF